MIAHGRGSLSTSGQKIMTRALMGIFAAISLMLNLAMPAAAASLEDAVAAYRKGDYTNALQLYRPHAEQGLAVAQFNVGLMYDMGQGVLQNYSEAVKWYRLAADQGRPDAQYQLGHLYYKHEKYAEAAKWFRLAADQGRADAQSNLGAMYAEGEGGPQDFVQALKWFILAAAQNHNDAIQNRNKAVLVMTPDQVAEARKLAGQWKLPRSGPDHEPAR
jgi:TPR repeat protein